MHCLGFSEPAIQWFISYLTNRLFSVNLGNEFSSPSKLPCGVPQGSILGPLLFLLYVNDMPQAVSCELLLYANDTCLICVGKDIQTIDDQLNEDFSSVCEWFIDSKLSIHFGETMATKVLGTINGRLNFLYRKQKFLSFSLGRLLCNALIQPHFDYACAAWYPNLNKGFVKKSKSVRTNALGFV